MDMGKFLLYIDILKLANHFTLTGSQNSIEIIVQVSNELGLEN